jgi:hypothetical protein
MCAEYFIALGRTRGPLCDGGTFLGTDAWGGFLALVDQVRKNAGKAPLTNVQANLYAAARGGGNFVKITRGCNDYYCAGPKLYDNITGLGVPDVAKLVAWLSALP